MKKRFILTFPAGRTNNPITYDLIKKYNIKINIIKANIGAEEEGSLLLEMIAEESDLNNAQEYLKENNINCQSVEKRVQFIENECMHCGACTAVCFAGALTLGKDDWKLSFDATKCIVCELCVKACPLGLFEIHFSE